MPDSVHQIAVDHSEGHSALLDAVRRSGAFEMRFAHLATDDYIIDNKVLIERESVADFAASLLESGCSRRSHGWLTSATGRFS